VVGRSKLGCGLPPALSFKDVHHPCWGGRRAESGSCLLHGPVTRFFLQHSGEKAFTGLAEKANFGYAGPAGCKRCQLPRAWLPGSDGPGAASNAASCHLVGAWLSVHRTGDGRAVRGSATSTASPAPLAVLGGSYKTSYATGVAAAFLDGLVLTPWEDRSEDLFTRAEVATVH
jgi:hypothetical protein